ncbi:MAG: putative metal-binding motif-containing protein [Nanoarchaeota archaeon]|nr:putative metal-binding motif-containing protein [Nanoarchaeota archaeon]
MQKRVGVINTRFGQITIEYMVLICLIIVILLPAIIIYHDQITSNKEDEQAMANAAVTAIGDEINTMVQMGSGWKTLDVAIPSNAVELVAPGQGEIIIRFSDGSEVVHFLPKGTYVFNQDFGFDLTPGASNKIKVTNNGNYFCIAKPKNDCVENACIDEDGDGFFKNCGDTPEDFDCDDTNPFARPDQEDEGSIDCQHGGAYSTCCDGVDNDCDGEIDEDWDEDQDRWYPITEENECSNRIFDDSSYQEGTCLNQHGLAACFDCEDDPALDGSIIHPRANPNSEQCDEVDTDCDHDGYYSGGNSVFEAGGFPTGGHRYISRSCKDLFQSDSACYVEVNVQCIDGSPYFWDIENCKHIHGDYNDEESPAEGNCHDGVDNDCDGLKDDQDDGCIAKSFFLTFDTSFHADECGGECVPEATTFVDLVAGKGIKNGGVFTKAMKVRDGGATVADLHYQGVDNVFLNKGTVYFFVKDTTTGAERWTDNKEYILFEMKAAGVENYVHIFKADNQEIKIKMDNPGPPTQGSLGDTSLWGKDIFHLIAFTWDVDLDNYKLIVDDSSVDIEGSGWPIEDLTEIYLGSQSQYVSLEAGEGLMFDNLSIYASALDANDIKELHEEACHRTTPCTTRYGDWDAGGETCWDSGDYDYLNTILNEDFPYVGEPCMDVNEDCMYTQADKDMYASMMECVAYIWSGNRCIQEGATNCLYKIGTGYLAFPALCEDADFDDDGLFHQDFCDGTHQCFPPCIDDRLCSPDTGKCYQEGTGSPIYAKGGGEEEGGTTPGGGGN